tara:strand:+ start:171 stop:464 length:294 start_codon:yes stop_codon:yes gene_type:complete
VEEEEAAVAEEALPSAQEVHVVEEVAAVVVEYLPELHAVQVEDEDAEVAEDHLPGAHDVQDEAPSEDVYFPAPQVPHVADPTLRRAKKVRSKIEWVG